jgi:hypothetical protein
MSGAGKGKGKNRQTRFPVARIKRIMQKDEEVGKVAQATPVVICERHYRIIVLDNAHTKNTYSKGVGIVHARSGWCILQVM